MATDEITTYQIDAAMLGPDWTGDMDDLRRFGEILQGLIGDRATVDVITDSHNGADNSTEDGYGLTFDDEWNLATQAIGNERPNVWAI